MLLSIGASYFTKKHDREDNFGNQAISTDFVWSFRSFIYYKLAKENPSSWQIGLGFFHHSNGHTLLPNQGLNSVLFSVSKPLIAVKSKSFDDDKSKKIKSPETLKYFSFRSGLGISSLSIPEPFNDKELVNTVSIGFGKIFNKNYKVGIGAYYNFYKHYYNYISNNESMVQDGREFENLKSNPSWNATAIGVSMNGELLLNHIGMEMRVGFNIHKPAYKIDRRINQGWYFFPRSFEVEDGYPLAELDTKYKLKRYISSRIGLKYYLFSMNKPPKHNIVFGAHINANFGQADFTEFSVGYLYTFR